MLLPGSLKTPLSFGQVENQCHQVVCCVGRMLLLSRLQFLFKKGSVKASCFPTTVADTSEPTGSGSDT